MENQTPENNNVVEETPVNNASEDNTIKISKEEVLDAIKNPSQGMATGAFVCGIVSLVLNIISFIPVLSTLCCCLTSAAPVLAIVAIVLGLVDKSKNGGFTQKGKIGMILGIVSLALGVIGTIIGFIVGFSSGLLSALGEI